MLLEIQAVLDSEGNSPRLLSVGLERDRLPILLSITSSLCGKALPKWFFAFDEVGLMGETRPAPPGQVRLKEVMKIAHFLSV